MFVYGVGDHCGGPTKRDIERIICMNEWSIFPNIRFSTARTFYEALEKEISNLLPIIRGELNTEFADCYTEQSLIKRSIRIAENRLLDCESAVTFAEIFGKQNINSDESLLDAWRNTLLLHFHDILPKSCVHDTRTYAHELFQNVVAFTSAKETMALRLLAEQMSLCFYFPKDLFTLYE